MTLTPQVEIPPKLIIYVAPADADIFEAIFLFEVTTAEFIEAFAQAFKLPVTPFLLLTIRALRELAEAEIHQILMFPYKNLLNRLNLYLVFLFWLFLEEPFSIVNLKLG